jgi:hypothetical protein
MNNFEEQIEKLASTVKLSDAEKSVMRRELLERINTHKNKLPQSIASPFSIFSFVSYHRVRVLSAAFMVVVFLTTSTSVLADKALPGDILYSVKTKINEPVGGLFAVTDFDKASWSVTLANRRIDEAEMIADRVDVSDEIKSSHYALLADQVHLADIYTKSYDNDDDAAATDHSSFEGDLMRAKTAFVNDSSVSTTEMKTMSFDSKASAQSNSEIALASESDNKASQIQLIKESLREIEEKIARSSSDGTSKEKLLRLNAKKALIKSKIISSLISKEIVQGASASSSVLVEPEPGSAFDGKGEQSFTAPGKKEEVELRNKNNSGESKKGSQEGVVESAPTSNKKVNVNATSESTVSGGNNVQSTVNSVIQVAPLPIY